MVWRGAAISWEAVWSCLAGSRVGDSGLMWGKEERCYLLWRIEKGLASRVAVPRSAHRPVINEFMARHSGTCLGSRHDDDDESDGFGSNRSAIYCYL